MKKSILKMFLLTLVIFAPFSAMAGVSIHVDIPLPPPIIFPAPPNLVVIPETDVYAVPGIQEDIFFYGGWWWRPWQDRWYRSRYYDRGWVFYPNPPYFYHSIPPGWRENYRVHQWKGYHWDYRPIPHHELQRNWNTWQNNRYWEQRGWGMQGYHPPAPQPYRHERQKPKPQPGHGQGPEHYSPR